MPKRTINLETRKVLRQAPGYDRMLEVLHRVSAREVMAAKRQDPQYREMDKIRNRERMRNVQRA